MKTCKDCKFCKYIKHESYDITEYIMQCKLHNFYRQNGFEACKDFKQKTNDMTKEQQFIKDSYNILKSSPCQTQNEWAKKIEKDLPELVKNKLPKTWKEYCEIIECNEDFANMKYIEYIYEGIHNDKKVLVQTHIRDDSKYTALRKLELLRDYYNDGWKPDWTDDDKKYVIYTEGSGIQSNGFAYNMANFLAFKSEELRDEFYTNFKDLIIQAEDLI